MSKMVVLLYFRPSREIGYMLKNFVDQLKLEGMNRTYHKEEDNGSNYLIYNNLINMKFINTNCNGCNSVIDNNYIQVKSYLK